jgi:glycosyltransferase involved in cell wall biosynthesis/O-antigen ligase
LTALESAARPASTPTAAPASPPEPITFLIYSPYPRYSGGRENWLYNLSGALEQRGRPVTVVSHASRRRQFYPDVPGVKVVSLPSIRYFDQFFLWFNRFGVGLPTLFDVLIAYPLIAAWHLLHTRPKSLVCMNSIPEGLAATLAGVPFTVSVRGDVPAEMSRGFKVDEKLLARLERWVLGRAQLVLANGKDTRDRLMRRGIDSQVVPNGVDLARFRSPDADSDVARRMVEAANGRPVIVVVGTLRAVKGSRSAIECAVELKRLGVRFMMAMVGKGAIDYYRRIVESRGVEDVVWFSGETPDVPSVLRHADMFLAVSGGSGLSMAVLEAMAAGTPVVALDSPVYTQLIEDGVNGVLAAQQDLALACRDLLRDPDKQRSIGARAARTADQYDWPLVAARVSAAMPPSVDGADDDAPVPPTPVARFAALAPSVLLPLLMLTLPLEFTRVFFPTNLIQVSRIVMVVMILTLLVGGYAGLKIRLPDISLWLPPAALVLYAGLSSVVTNSLPGVKVVAAALAYSLVGLAIYNWTRDRGVQERMWLWFAISCIGLSLIGVLQRATGGYIWNAPDVGLSRINATFYDPNVLGRVLTMMIVAGVALAPAIAGRKTRVVLVAATMLASAALPFTYSRQAWVFGGVVLLLAVITSRQRRDALLLTGASLAVFVAVTVLVPEVQARINQLQHNLVGAPSHLFERPGLAFLNYLPLDSERHYLIAAGLQMFYDHPLFGLGFGKYPAAISGPYHGFILSGYTTIASHTSLVTILAELGLVGFALTAWWVYAYTRQTVAAVRRDGAGRAYVLAPFMAIAVIFLESQLNGRLFDEPYLFVFLGLAAAAMVQPAATTVRAATSQNSTARSFFQ